MTYNNREFDFTGYIFSKGVCIGFYIDGSYSGDVSSVITVSDIDRFPVKYCGLCNKPDLSGTITVKDLKGNVKSVSIVCGRIV